jgi:hypothetical protein
MPRGFSAALGVVVACAACAPVAQAGVIVWRSTTSNAIMEASDTGHAPHVVGHGSAPYISPDATQLAYGSGANQLTIASLSPGATPRVIPGTWGGFLAWSPDSRRIGAQIGTSLKVLSAAAGGKTVTIAHADHGWLSFSPSSLRVAFDGYNDVMSKPDLPLETVPVTGGPTRKLQDRSPGATGICWSSTNVIAFAVSSGGPVFTDAITPGGAGHVVARTQYDTYPDGWSSDGSRLLIETDQPDGAHLGYVTASTGTITTVPGTHAYTFVQGISRDGKRALVTGKDAQGQYVAVVRLSDGKRVTLIHRAVDPSWTS